MADYVYPGIFLSYLLFTIFVVGALYFFARSFHDGYWGAESEDPKYRMLGDEEAGHGNG